MQKTAPFLAIYKQTYPPGWRLSKPFDYHFCAVIGCFLQLIFFSYEVRRQACDTSGTFYTRVQYFPINLPFNEYTSGTVHESGPF